MRPGLICGWGVLETAIEECWFIQWGDEVYRASDMAEAPFMAVTKAMQDAQLTAIPPEGVEDVGIPPWKKGGGGPAPSFTIGPPERRGEIIGIYGSGGVGKTLLSALIERTCGSVVFIDLDDSLGSLRDKLDELGLSPQRVGGIDTWAQLISLLESDALNAFKSIVIDTASEAENMAMQHVVENIRCENGTAATSIESYGYGKGYRYLHDQFLDLRAVSKAHAAKGRNVIINMHQTTATVPHPEGVDYIRYEPKLYQDKSVSLRATMQNSLDHLLFIGYDIKADKAFREKHGKAVGTGTRMIYPQEEATFMAKSRRLSDPVPYEYGDDALWRALFNTNKEI